MGVTEAPTSGSITISVRQAMAKAWSEIADTLPDAPENGRCSTCGWGVFVLISEGVAGVYSINYVTDHWHAWTDGWDDIDDSPIAQWIACTSCDTAYGAPEMDWN
jgi:hypothetical protein